MAPNAGQLALVIASILLFAIGGILSIARLRSQRPGTTEWSKALLIAGVLANIAVLSWHAATRGSWLPLEDSFDSLVWLATLLALFILYVQRHRALGGLDWFVMPIVILLLVGAAVFGHIQSHQYVTDTWSWVHRVTAYGGAVAFAIAAAAGAMYVLSSRRLRTKSPMSPMFGSLERLEHLTMVSVTLGFALLTVGMITGGIKIIADRQHTPIPKVVLAVGVWVVYAIVLHAPINPSFRGRKVALLSIAGFVLMLGVIITVLLMPAGGSR